MAGSIGRVTTPVATFHNETSISLANLNFDFTLIKLDAPKEFSAVGATISSKRKIDAEEGPLHQTARKLSALFAGVVPSTQALFRAYGRRVSEISAMSSVNPQASSRDGMFASHIGADSGSIWAAATSGETAIAVHLLACMLARLFTGPEATSVWVELVEKQRESIKALDENDMYSRSHDLALSAAKQPISRSDLAKWDASARAWLQSADAAKALQHKQMMLILNNASIPVNNEPDIYRSVVRAWTGALQAMNSLINGIPQQVQDGAALLAISSWHIYPDMVVHGNSTAEVRQRDPFFESTAILTLGLEMLGKRKSSVSWSLPLARLQYYGLPVQASRSAGEDNSRITHDQFGYIVLGSLFKTWKDFSKTPEEGMTFLEELSKYSKERTNDLLPKNSEGQPSASFWLDHLLLTARRYLKLEGVDRQLAGQLLNLGRRRSRFLFASNNPPYPVFGLSYLPTLLPILKDNQCRLSLLRKLFSSLNLRASDFIIGYQPKFCQASSSQANPVPREFAALEPAEVSTTSLGKRALDGLRKGSTNQPVYCRWILLELVELAEYYITSKGWNNCQWVFQMLVKLDAQRGPPTAQWQNRMKSGDNKRNAWISDALKRILDMGEHCLPAVQTTWRLQSKGKLIFGSGADFLDATARILRELDMELKSESNHATPYTLNKAHELFFFTGHAQSAAIYCLTPQRETNLLVIDNAVKPEILREAFLLQLLDGVNLGTHLASSEDQSIDDQTRPLKVCAAIADLYRKLPGATISTLVTSRPLYEAQWIPKYSPPIALLLSLRRGFACIAMLDSGTCDLDPAALGEVFAMATGNSLYVASVLLDDPHSGLGQTGIQRVIGNIGRAGMSLLISPPQPKIRDPNEGNWREVNHYPFDGIPEDSFRQTSIHLSFTDYEMPLSNGVSDQHIIDRPIALVETLVSVHDSGKWVADVDIVGALNPQSKPPTNRLCRISCCKASEERGNAGDYHQAIPFEDILKSCPALRASRVDNWEELLEPPEDPSGSMVVRSQSNWLARLALAAVCWKLQYRTFLLPREVCWSCCVSKLETIKGDTFKTHWWPTAVESDNEDDLEQFDSLRPAVNIGMLENLFEPMADIEDDTRLVFIW